MGLSTLFLYLFCVLNANNSRGREIAVPAPKDLKNRSFVDFEILSFGIGVFAEHDVMSMYDAEISTLLKPYIQRQAVTDFPGGNRGIPPSNWAKFNLDGHNFGLFTYKTLHRCNNLGKKKDRWLFDILNTHHISKRAQKGASQGEAEADERWKRVQFYTRLAAGRKQSIHSVTTRLGEAYSVSQVQNMTANRNTESDVRVVPIPPECRSLIRRRMGLPDKDPLPSLVLTGSYMHARSFFRESQFLAVATMGKGGDIRPLKSWILDDKEGYVAKKTQKNWLPFFVGGAGASAGACSLMLSTRFAPDHIVAPFEQWDQPCGALVLFDRSSASLRAMTSPTPSTGVHSPFAVRGSAPPIQHPSFTPGYLLGCVHIKGRFKVYRHALFVMRAVVPFNIVSFSGFFVFSPFRNIEFVTSLFVDFPGKDEGGEQSGAPVLQLTHGSSDCEPRIAVYPLWLLRAHFGEYMLPPTMEEARQAQQADRRTSRGGRGRSGGRGGGRRSVEHRERIKSRGERQG